MFSKMLAVLVILCAMGTSCTGSAKPSPNALKSCHPSRILRVGDHIPDCEFRTDSGSVLKLTSLLTKPTVMNFWASWCTECIKEMPAFERVYTRLHNRVNVVGFNALGVQGETESAARSFAKARGVTYPIAFDQGGLLYSHFSFQTLLPVTVLVSRSGKIVFRQFGELDESSLTDLISTYLKI